MSEDFNIYGDWKDQPAGDDIEVLDEWFNSSAWKSICEHADRGDRDSLDLMEDINSLLGSLVFHLQNDARGQRVDYEINQFRKIIEDFK